MWQFDVITFNLPRFVGAIKGVRYGPLFNINSGYERLLSKYGTSWGYQDPCTKFRKRRNICHNGGICVNKFSNYSCDCLGTGYEGRNCNIGKFYFRKL